MRNRANWSAVGVLMGWAWWGGVGCDLPGKIPVGDHLPPDSGTEALRFEDITCQPEVPQAEVAAGRTIECSFRLAGVQGENVTLSCESETGAPIECGDTPGAIANLELFHPNSGRPAHSGAFYMNTEGRAGTTPVVFWVAHDGTSQARHRFEAKVVADDGVNEAPSIRFNCLDPASGKALVQAGSTLSCSIQFLDPDPGQLTWSYRVAPGQQPLVNEATPFGGTGPSGEVFWRWQTDASEAGREVAYEFTVSDGKAPPVTRTLAVSVARVGTEPLRFEGVTCQPVNPSAGVVEGTNIECYFRLAGVQGENVTLSCMNDTGAPVECGATSSPNGKLGLFDPNTGRPAYSGFYYLGTAGRAGTTTAVTWVATDGTSQVHHRFEAKVVAREAVNRAPSISFDCGGNTTGTVLVKAGSTLSCSVQFLDPDQDSLTWSYGVALTYPSPVNQPTPHQGNLPQPATVVWTWETNSGDAVKNFAYEFTVSDNKAPSVTKRLVVSVEE